MILLIRHGQTIFNAERRFQGSLDSPLTAIGRMQAQAVGEKLRGIIGSSEAVLFTSPRGGRAGNQRHHHAS